MFQTSILATPLSVVEPVQGLIRFLEGFVPVLYKGSIQVV